MLAGSVLLDLMRDDRGSHTTEMSLAIALFALVAGFGFFSFGDALADFFNRMAGIFPEQLATPTFGLNPLQ